MHFVLSVLFLTVAVAVNPGIQLLFTQRAIYYANKIAIGVINKEVKSVTLPDQKGKEHHVEYKLENLRMSSFILRISKLSLASGSNLKWTASNIELDVKGKFHYKYRKHLIKISDHGSISVKARGISIGLTLQLGVNINRKPSVKPSQCTSGVGKVDVKFHGGRAFIYNLFRHKVEKAVHDQLQKQICTMVNSLVKKKAEQTLSKLNVQFDVTKFLSVDCGLTSAPSVLTNDLKFDLKGEAFWKGNRTPVPLTPPTMRTSGDETRMITVLMSDYVFNTLAYRATKHGMMSRNITSKDLPSGDMLNTTCTGMCIGKVIPQIGHAFPDCKVEVEIKTDKRPTIKIRNNSVAVNGTTVVNLIARKSDRSLHFLFRINAEGSGTFLPNLTNASIHGKVGTMSVHVNVTNSTIGTINKQTLQFLVNTAISSTVKPMLDKYGARGIPLPAVYGLRLQQPSIKLVNNEIVVSTNIQMTSTEDNATVLKFIPFLQI